MTRGVRAPYRVAILACAGGGLLLVAASPAGASRLSNTDNPQRSTTPVRAKSAPDDSAHSRHVVVEASPSVSQREQKSAADASGSRPAPRTSPQQKGDTERRVVNTGDDHRKVAVTANKDDERAKQQREDDRAKTHRDGEKAKKDREDQKAKKQREDDRDRCAKESARRCPTSEREPARIPVITPIVMPKVEFRPDVLGVSRTLAAAAHGIFGSPGVYEAPRPAASRAPIPVLPLTGSGVPGEAFAGSATLLAGIVLLTLLRRTRGHRTTRGAAGDASSNLRVVRSLNG